MAYEEIIPDPFVSKKFVKIKDAGEKFEGYYLKNEPGNYSKEDFYFRAADGSLQVISAGKQLRKLLDKAALSEGNKVIIAIKSVKRVEGLDFPVPEWKVGVDRAPKVKMPEASDSASPVDDPF